MSEAIVIENTKQPITKESLSQDFRQLGLTEKDIVLVHSSMSAIGWVCGEERTVIEALIQTLGEEGTLCMPSHSGQLSDPSAWRNPPVPQEWNQIIYETMPAYDPVITPTRGIGRIPEVFRTYPGVIRSNHPQTSFCAFGKFAKEITEGHALTPQFGMESPLGRMYQLDAKVLMLGNNYDTCTSFHMGEVLCGKTAHTKLGAPIKVNGNREWIWFEDYEYDCGDFDQLGLEFEKQREVFHGRAGNAECRLFSIRAAVDFAAEWLKTHR